MIEIKGDLFDMSHGADAICITTNGFVKTNGENVMGKGCAKTVADNIPSMPATLGSLIKENGNVAQVLTELHGVHLVSFPVKPESIFCLGYNDDSIVAHMRGKFSKGDMVPGWAATAKIYMISMSCKQLIKLADEYGWKKVVIPRPGCGAGELDWSTVKHWIEPMLDDRFHIITW